MPHGTFGTVINCMDGRTQEPVACWLKERYHLDFVDTITEPGADRFAAQAKAAALDPVRSPIEKRIASNSFFLPFSNLKFKAFFNSLQRNGKARQASNGVDYLKQKIKISIDKHGSRLIAIVGHHDCAGNPVSPEKHWAHIRKAVEIVKTWNLPSVEVIGLWVNERWEVEIAP